MLAQHSLKAKTLTNGIDAIRIGASAMASKLIFVIMAILLLINPAGCNNSHNDSSSLDVMYLNDYDQNNLAIVYYSKATDEGFVVFKNDTTGKYDKAVFTFSDKTQAIMAFTPDGKKLSSFEIKGYVYTYSNFTDSTVDVSLKRPDGTTDTDKGVALNKHGIKTTSMILKPIREFFSLSEISNAFAEDSEQLDYIDSIQNAVCGSKTCADDFLKQKLENIQKFGEFIISPFVGIYNLITDRIDWFKKVDTSPTDSATSISDTLKIKAGYEQISEPKCERGDQFVTGTPCNLPNGKGQEVKVCDENGNWNFATCELLLCNSGYVVRGGLCVKPEDVCDSYGLYRKGQSCEAPGASEAYQYQLCTSRGVWEDYACKVISCKDGYISTLVDKTGIVCNEDKCTSDQKLESLCKIDNGKGINVKFCDQNGKWLPDPFSCTPTSCDPGYKISGNSCVDDCTPGQEGMNKTCTVGNVTGEQVRVCDQSGKWGDYGACIPPCTPGDAQEKSCSTPNGTGVTYRHCDSNGKWGAWGEVCGITSCNHGQIQEGETCSIPNGTGIQVRVCDQSGKWGASVCTPNSCVSGYTLSGNSCVQGDCVGRKGTETSWKEGCYNSSKKEEGEWKIYSNGKLSEIVTYVNGIANGPYKHFFENGVVSLQGNLKNGLYDGAWETYQSDGTLSTRTNFKDGKRDGVSESYHSDGTVSQRIHYKDGKKDGLFEEFNYKGELTRSAIFSMDILVSCLKC